MWEEAYRVRVHTTNKVDLRVHDTGSVCQQQDGVIVTSLAWPVSKTVVCAYRQSSSSTEWMCYAARALLTLLTHPHLAATVLLLLPPFWPAIGPI